MFFVRVNWIAVATQRGHLNPAVGKFFLPRLGLGGVFEKFGHGTMFRARVAARADLHRFETERADLVEHFIKRKIVVNGVEDADGNFALRRSRSRRLLPRRGSSLGASTKYGVLHVGSSRNGRGQQASAGRSEKLPAVNRFTSSRATHANPPKSPSHPGQITARGIIRLLSGRGSHKIVLVGMKHRKSAGEEMSKRAEAKHALQTVEDSGTKTFYASTLPSLG